ncbi:hypothetical protein F4808DRAFT_417981 [Astrocystis sublimbata]|nr:hypothetical protein F4808DRAFT_417981 [Astrocystis sublimbata]
MRISCARYHRLIMMDIVRYFYVAGLHVMQLIHTLLTNHHLSILWIDALIAVGVLSGRVDNASIFFRRKSINCRLATL